MWSAEELFLGEEIEMYVFLSELIEQVLLLTVAK